MLRYVVYTEGRDDEETHWFKTEAEARSYITTLMKEAEEELADREGQYPDWATEITLLVATHNVVQVPDGLSLDSLGPLEVKP